jgi:hypothetical protein
MNTDWHREILVDGLTPRQKSFELNKLAPKKFQKPEYECVIHLGMYKVFCCGSCEIKENMCFVCFIHNHNGHVLNKISSVGTSTSSSSNFKSSKKDQTEVRKLHVCTFFV